MTKAAVSVAALLAMGACADKAATDVAAAHDSAAHAEAEHVPEQTGSVHAAEHVAADGAAASDDIIVGSRDGHGMHYKTPSLEALGGKFDLVEAQTGKRFTDKDLLGSWSLVYLGYMECLEACPIALKSMPAAVKDLQATGIPAKAVFIDINAPRLDDMSGAMGHAEKGVPATGGGHGSHGVSSGATTGPDVRRKAIASWSKLYDPSIIMLSGTRKQVNDAKRIFMSRVEQSMLPTTEVIHHLNHTTMIYAINPKGEVAGILYHSDPSKVMVAAVTELARRAEAAPI